LKPQDQMPWEQLCPLERNASRPLHVQIREAIVQAVLDNRLLPDSPIPSTRALASALQVSRNTVVRAYDSLAQQGYLVADAASGHRVSRPLGETSSLTPPSGQQRDGAGGMCWEHKIAARASSFRQVVKPPDWQQFRYPFVFGQFDPSLFPSAQWREVCELAVRRMSIRDWVGDLTDRDDPTFITQLQKRVLPRRGIWANADEILVTLGSQQAMYLLSIFIRKHAKLVGIEEPGYPDLRNLFYLSEIPFRSIPVLKEGINVDDNLSGCDYVFVTPNHQNPTCTVMPHSARAALLEAAISQDFVIVEDDYESEILFDKQRPTPAIKSFDSEGRVIYVGSLSKTLAAGLRIGFIVADKSVIKELRALRRLILRHPPANNQRLAALFISLGYYDSLINRLSSAYQKRAKLITDAAVRYLPEVRFNPPSGGSALWLRAPEGTDMSTARERAMQGGVLFDAGEDFFSTASPPKNFFRLGFSSIEDENIEPGIIALAQELKL